MFLFQSLSFFQQQPASAKSYNPAQIKALFSKLISSDEIPFLMKTASNALLIASFDSKNQKDPYGLIITQPVPNSPNVSHIKFTFDQSGTPIGVSKTTVNFNNPVAIIGDTVSLNSEDKKYLDKTLSEMESFKPSNQKGRIK